MDDDRFDLERFVAAQDTVIDQALGELQAGRKRGHWMWFVFPQLRGLGGSPTARRFAIVSLSEAEAYLAHPVLAPRLRACTEAVLASPAPSLAALFGSPDDLKFRSSMTLFAIAEPNDRGVFAQALEQRCEGRPDSRTHSLLGLDAG